jgi:hypothetical protein
MSDAQAEKWICALCDQEMVLRTVDFGYMGHRFQTKLFKCVSCGQIYIPAELAEGKMVEVEMLLEDK